jgi:transposase
MTEKRDVVRRLQQRQSLRGIGNETGLHRVTIRKIKRTAEVEGWLEAGARLPSEQEVARVFSLSRGSKDAHPLDRIKNKIEEWLDDEDVTYTVVHTLVQDYVPCSEATVRRYVQRTFPQHPKVVVPRNHEAGIMEVDFGYAGLTYDWVERRDRKTYLFSGRLALSRYAWRERVYKMDQETFLRCHIHAFDYFGGVPLKVVPDNLKQAVVEASFTEPVPNAVYQEFAIHYGFLISPCLPAMPEHKGGVESDIKYIKRNFWPVFRERQKQKGRPVPDGADMATELASWSSEVAHKRKIKGVGVSPVQLFTDMEKEALRPIPAEPWTRLEVSQAKVQSTWCIQFRKAFYSVPWQYVGKTVRVMANSTTVRIFCDHEEIATHPRARHLWETVRNRLHEPPNATEYIETTRAGVLQRAKALGASVAEVCRQLFEQKGVDGLRPARALLALAKSYGPARLQAACQRVLAYDTVSYRSVHACLKHELDYLPLEPVSAAEQREFTFARPAGFFAAGGTR